MTPLDCLKEIVAVRQRMLDRALEAESGSNSADDIDQLRIDLLQAQLALALEKEGPC